MARLVLTDASPLIGLAIVGGLEWLESLFGRVWMPREVEREVLPGPELRGHAELRAALAAGWLRVWKNAPSEPSLPDLDEGETACIRIAIAHRQESLLLMDERAGRVVAIEHGLRVAGTAAVIGMAKARGLIPSAKAAFETLHDSDFRISPGVIQTALRRVGA
jgi:predicted nucleic acid-binding protein